MQEARNEAYQYFDQNIRELPKNADGKIDLSAKGFQHNDVDAFRHAYVSGVFTQEYSENIADIFGRLNEFFGPGLYSNSRNRGALNMDLWNNSIGRKYGQQTKNRKELLRKIHQALEKGELITDPSDSREYKGAKNNPEEAKQPIIVLQESETGRNELFFDLIKKKILTRNDFVSLIQQQHYPGYTVKEIGGILTPVSQPDNDPENNLG